jgi:hypothetical protein
MHEYGRKRDDLLAEREETIRRLQQLIDDRGHEEAFSENGASPMKASIWRRNHRERTEEDHERNC